MILFINGFEITHWAKHEVTVRNKQCYTGAAVSAVIDLPVGAGQAGYCLTQSFKENKQGNVYSPSRDISEGSISYQGKRMDYFDPVEKQIAKGFNDDRLFFINGSSDNRTTGAYRYQIGVGIGKKILDNWAFLDAYEARKNEIKSKIERDENYPFIDPLTRPTVMRMHHMDLTQLENELLKRDKTFHLGKYETLKLVGHSMGAAIAAGVAATIASNPKYADKVEVVLYLAPHQPQDFVHPAQVNGYQSSSAEDLVASKNDITIPVGQVLPIFDIMQLTATSVYNSTFGRNNPRPYQVGVPVSIAWAKGTTAYQVIKNIPQSHFIQNKTHTLGSQNGHGVGTYIDEIDTFFKMYVRRR